MVAGVLFIVFFFCFSLFPLLLLCLWMGFVYVLLRLNGQTGQMSGIFFCSDDGGHSGGVGFLCQSSNIVPSRIKVEMLR